jgi:hypothetical protein
MDGMTINHIVSIDHGSYMESYSIIFYHIWYTSIFHGELPNKNPIFLSRTAVGLSWVARCAPVTAAHADSPR